MRTGKVEVPGIPVPFRNGHRTKRNLGPFQVKARQVHSFDVLPASESMQAVFQPVMIPGRDEEQDKAECEHRIAECRPSQFMRNDSAEEAAGKNCKASRGKPRADAAAVRFQTGGAPQCMNEMLLAGWFQSW